MELAQFGDPVPLPKDANGLRHVARALIVKAIGGDAPAIKEIADRIDGKVPQAVVGGDDGESPVRMIIEWQTTASSASESRTSPVQPSAPSTNAEPAGQQS